MLANADYDYQAEVSWLTGNDKVDALIESLTPEQKVSLVHGAVDTSGNQQQAGYVVPIESMGIPEIRLTDGEAGINIVHNSTGSPMQLNVAATWSLDAAYQHGVITGKESKLFNIAVALYPRVNILRDVYEGNFWQSFSEDPFLNARLGVQSTKAVQDQGTMANPKQIGPSYSGASGSAYNSIVDKQVLKELYWVAPGTLLQEGNGATLMCSYTKVNGVQACQNQDLFDTIRNEYNSSAIVVSDWGATHSAAESLIAGLDLEMPTGDDYYDTLYDYIYVSKNLSESYLNRAVGHILAKYDEFNLLNTTTGGSSPLPADVVEEHGDISYDIAVKSGVLLKNENNVLPITNGTSIAVIGPNGVQYTHGTNFAERAYGFPERQISTLEALKTRLGEDVAHTVGVDQEGSIIPSTHLRNLNGDPGLSRNDTNNGTSNDDIVYFTGTSELPAGASYTWQGQLFADTAGYYTISFTRAIPNWENHTNVDYGQIFAIGTLTVNETESEGYRLYGDGGVKPWSNSIATRDGWDNIKVYVHLDEGWHDINAYIVGLIDEPTSVRLTWVTPAQRAANIQEAVDIAQTVDTPVVFAFANSPAQEVMILDDGLDELIEKVAAVNPNTVVVLNNAEPVEMPWLNSVAAVLEMMYPNQEGGWATADLLLGNHNPQGRLPVTYPTSVNTSMTRNPDYPERIPDAEENITFSEGINNGYRWYTYSNTTVLFPFGYGLSYTSFEYSNPNFQSSDSASQSDFSGHYEVSISPDDAEVKFSVSITITNSGSVKGVEVPQVYIGPPTNAETVYPGIQFASIALVGFGNVELEAGESATVTIGIRDKQLSYYNVSSSSWELASGQRPIYIAKSAEDLVFAGLVQI
ncbi:hypothetical protein BBO99_00007138 [Phytophthora kernoviae]|uniref:beta-glucosidase n=2 Tax=Phytophthora kernoviae TaxID=325452 RepID=A0A3R7KB95_9STRA|nr:hypothetical protein G195_007980 [Phytophthora kernoviae 00238/432]KAG2520785.1 hypothetical protein JM16_006594 [Phytophthora kernoviae]KAG2521555.1 hypothetical protein JM18_006527 [Phytophthora kernoviae]RLN44787.1 hypothetical protein BBI17_007025 [Phytophthora kernoviae]RLN76974.1 hypothetical protein BBO99_00007138 [Phytophthora kernoviae]